MIKLSKKSFLLFVSALAVAAFAMPSLSSASTFDPVGTNHTLTSTNLGFSVPTLAGGAVCASSTFEVTVASATDARVTAATFADCTGNGSLANTTATVTVTGLPWTVTPVGDSFVIDAIHLVNHFETAAGVPGPLVTLTGNLNGPTWTNSTHEGVYSSTGGLSAHIGGLGGSVFPAVVSGTIRDDQQTLTVTT